MKRHVQNAGIRRWSGDDLIELQSEPFKVLDKFFGQFGPMIVSGCTVSGTNISEGLVLLPDKEGIARIIPFKGARGVFVFPVYLTLKKETVSREYENATVQPIAYSYEAVLSQTRPVSGFFITISNTTKNNAFIDAIQDTAHRFVTDAQITNWSKPRNFIISEGVTDLDAFKSDGLRYFACENNTMGAPDFYEYHGISVIDSDQGAQLAFGTTNNHVFMRTLIDGVWGKWIKIWNEKSFPVIRENIVRNVLPFLPCRASEGDAYMLNGNSYLYNLKENHLPLEVYKFRVSRPYSRYFKGDENMKLLGSSGNEISKTERLNEIKNTLHMSQIAIYNRESLYSGYIPIVSEKCVIMINGDNVWDAQLAVDTFTHDGIKINTIPLESAALRTRCRAHYITTFSSDVKTIRIKIVGENVFFSALHVFNYINTIPRSTNLIYKYTNGEWKTFRINGNTVQVHGQHYNMHRDGEKDFHKAPTKKVPTIEFVGIDAEGRIKIKPLDSSNYICRFFIRKRVRVRQKRIASSTGKPIETVSRNIRYVEKVKKLKYKPGDRPNDVCSKERLVDNTCISYTLQELYNSIFKNTKHFSTTGLTCVSDKMSMPGYETYADIALCLAAKVNGKLVNGPKSYFRITARKMREK